VSARFSATGETVMMHNDNNLEDYVVNTSKYLSILSLAVIGALYGASPALATPILGSELASFSVLGAVSVTNTGKTTLSGNLGVSNNTSKNGITGFLGTLANDGPGTATGAVHQADAFAQTADDQLVIAMTSLGLMGSGSLLGADLTGLTLAPGVYTVPEYVSNLTGTLTLDGKGNANAFWVFLMQSTLITSTNSVVDVINTGAGAGVYWNVASSATLGTTSTFAGNILASTSITMGQGVTLNCGRALAHTGNVTMINDTINSTNCMGTGEEGSNGLSGGLTFAGGTPPGGATLPIALPIVPVSTVPEPGTVPLLGFGLAALFVFRRKFFGGA
jgi:hypothetical protein